MVWNDKQPTYGSQVPTLLVYLPTLLNLHQAYNIVQRYQTILSRRRHLKIFSDLLQGQENTSLSNLILEMAVSTNRSIHKLAIAKVLIKTQLVGLKSSINQIDSKYPSGSRSIAVGLLVSMGIVKVSMMFNLNLHKTGVS